MTAPTLAKPLSAGTMPPVAKDSDSKACSYTESESNISEPASCIETSSSNDDEDFEDCNENTINTVENGVDKEEDETTASSKTASDEELIAQADELLVLERLFEALKLIQAVQNKDLLQEKHHAAVASCLDIDAAIEDLLRDPDADDGASGWIKQAETHGKRDTSIYSMDDKTQLTTRIETPIETSLLVPLLAVLNETDLYHTWIPSWYMPSVGLRHSEKLQQQSRANQIIKITVNIPWPISGAEIVLQTTATDDIEDRNFIAIRLKSLMTGGGGGVVPPPADGLKRVPAEGVILLRKCPPDHPLLQKSHSEFYNNNDPPILLSFKIQVRAPLHIFPTAFVNFVTRTVIGRIWNMFIKVAEDVKEGKRPEHQAAIAEKQDFYNWVSERADLVLHILDQQQQAAEKAANTAAGEEMETSMEEDEMMLDAVEQEQQQEFVSYLQS